MEDSPHKVASIQAVPNRVAHVTFDVEEAKTYYERLGEITINGVTCEVIKPPPPPPQVTLVNVIFGTPSRVLLSQYLLL